MSDREKPKPFTFDLPVWAVAYRKGGDLPNSLTFVCGEDDGGRWLSIFTDEDLAERFIAASPAGMYPDPKPFKMATPQEFLIILESMLRAGVAKIAFDSTRKSGGDAARIACGTPIQEMINAIRSKLP